MSKELWAAICVLAVFVVFVVVKVIGYMRQSAAEWKQVDKSKLKEWDEQDD